MKLNLAAVEEIMREVGAAHIMPYFRKLAEGDIASKGNDGPVTTADKAAEVALAKRLVDLLPGSVVVGEEAFADNHALLQRLAGDHPIWLIDPLDGTGNFIAGRPEFGIMLALVQHGQTIAAWIHDPISGDTITAEKGSGVWLRGEKLRLAATDHGIISARLKAMIATVDTLQKDTWPSHTYGSCASFDYPRLFAVPPVFADKKTESVSYLFYPYTRPWDHVPGLLMHGECGGYSADWFGAPYNMVKPGVGLLVAPNKETWVQLHQTFQPLIHHVCEALALTPPRTACA